MPSWISSGRTWRQKKLRTEQEKLPEAQAKLDAEKARLEGIRKELEKTRAELDAAKKQLEEPEKQLQETRTKLDAAKKELDAQKKKLDEAADELAQNKKKLASDYEKLEDEKAGIRSAIRKVIENAYGGSTAELIDWAVKDKPDVNEEDVTAEEIRISGSYKAGLSKTWSQVIEGFVYSSAIPDDVLVRIYRNMKDDPNAEPDLKEVREFLAGQAIDHSADVKGQYEGLQPKCTKWNASHKEYLTARNDQKKAQNSYQEKLKQQETGEKDYKTAEEELKKALTEHEAGETEYTKAETEYKESLQAYETAQAEHDQHVKTVEESQKALQATRTSLDASEKEYNDNKTACEDGEKQLEEAIKELRNMPEAAWEIAGSDQNAGILQVEKDSDRQKGIAVVSALLFFVGLALAVWFTISRMVEGKRSFTGVTKISELVRKKTWLGHLLFGLSAAVMGAALGILLGRFVLEPAILESIGNRYVFDLDQRALSGGAATAVLLGSALLTAVMVSFACLLPQWKNKAREIEDGEPAGDEAEN